MGNFIYLAIYSRQNLFNSLSSSSVVSWSYVLLTMESPVLEKFSTFQRALCLSVPLKRSLWRPHSVVGSENFMTSVCVFADSKCLSGLCHLPMWHISSSFLDCVKKLKPRKTCLGYTLRDRKGRVPNLGLQIPGTKFMTWLVFYSK